MNISDEIKKFGYVKIRDFDSNKEFSSAIKAFGNMFSITPYSSVHTLLPNRRSTSTPNTYSGNFGLEAFPLHTDLAHWRKPPKYVALRCKVGAPNVATQLLDGKSIVENDGDSILSKALVRPRRPVAGAFPLLKIFDQVDNEGGILRWDSIFIEPASKNGKLGCKYVNDYINCTKPTPVFLSEPGDTLIFDNWRMIHGRSAVPPGSEERKIERVYLERAN